MGEIKRFPDKPLWRSKHRQPPSDGCMFVILPTNEKVAEREVASQSVSTVIEFEIMAPGCGPLRCYAINVPREELDLRGSPRRVPIQFFAGTVFKEPEHLSTFDPNDWTS